MTVLVEATEGVMSKQAGYVSANIHSGLDGPTVANYAQWRSREHFEAMLRHSPLLSSLSGRAATPVRRRCPSSIPTAKCRPPALPLVPRRMCGLRLASAGRRRGQCRR